VPYDLDFKNEASDKSKWLSGKALAAEYIAMIKKYGIVSIEVRALSCSSAELAGPLRPGRLGGVDPLHQGVGRPGCRR